MHISNPDPEAIFAGAVIAQVAFLAILGLGGVLIHQASRVLYRRDYDYARVGWLALFAGITGLVALVFSDKPSGLWGSLLGRDPLAGWSVTTGVSWAIGIDLACVAYIVWFTGGAKHSPFKELYFFLPMIAIFLRQPLGFVVGFSLSVAASFLVTLIVHVEPPAIPFFQGRLSLIYGLVTMLSFSVMSIIGIALEYGRQ